MRSFRRHHPRGQLGTRGRRAGPGWPSPAASSRRWRMSPSRAARSCLGRAAWPGALPHPARADSPPAREVDVVLPPARPVGETARSRDLLEMAGIRYVGAGVLASAVSMDKEYHEDDLQGPRPAGRAARGRQGAGLAARHRAARGRVGKPERKRVPRRDRRARLAAVREAGQGRVKHRHVQAADMPGCTRRSRRPGATTRRCSSRPRSTARDRVLVLEGGERRAAGHSMPGSC